jgi:hypothetical protein
MTLTAATLGSLGCALRAATPGGAPQRRVWLSATRTTLSRVTVRQEKRLLASKWKGNNALCNRS